MFNIYQSITEFVIMYYAWIIMAWVLVCGVVIAAMLPFGNDEAEDYQ